MTKICAVPRCGATTQNAKDRSFHQFPKDPDLRLAWIKRIGRENFRPDNNSSVCSQHFGEEHYRRPNIETPAQFRKTTLKPGSLPTYNLQDFIGSFQSTSSNNSFECGRATRLSKCFTKDRKKFRQGKSRMPEPERCKATSAFVKTKKRKLDHEFSKESHHSSPIPIAPTVTVPVIDRNDENIAPEKESSPSPDVSKSRRKAPRSHVRKVVRSLSQDKNQADANVTPSVLKSDVATKESLQKPQCQERTEQIQDPNDCSTSTCAVSTSSGNEKYGNSEQIVRENRLESANVANQTTVVEEDYQRKYFQLLNTMNDLQEKFLASQSSFEELVKVREAFIEELKSKLDNTHQEISSIKQELETSNDKIAELEEKRNVYESKILNLSEKVESMEVKEAEMEHRILKDRNELQRNIEKQQDVLDFYKLLTSVTVEKVLGNENEDTPNVYDKFRCCVKTAQAQEMQFLLSYDSEFAEIEYAPLALDSVDSSFPDYLKEQIFFESSQAPYLLQRLIQTFQKPGDK